MAAKPGSACSLSMKTPDVRESAWTPRIRGRCLRACGRWKCTPGERRAAVREAAFTFRTIAVQPGRTSRDMVCPTRLSARSTWRLRRRTRTASTHSLRPANRARCGAQTMAVANGTSWAGGPRGSYPRCGFSPADENMVLVSNSSFLVSLDGGQTFETKPWGGDNHDIWMDPKDPNRFAISFDGGLGITTVGGKGFHDVTLPIGQMYHVAVDDQFPYEVYGNMQDDSTMRGPSLPVFAGGRDTA